MKSSLNSNVKSKFEVKYVISIYEQFQTMNTLCISRPHEVYLNLHIIPYEPVQCWLFNNAFAHSAKNALYNGLKMIMEEY